MLVLWSVQDSLAAKNVKVNIVQQDVTVRVVARIVKVTFVLMSV